MCEQINFTNIVKEKWQEEHAECFDDFSEMAQDILYKHYLKLHALACSEYLVATNTFHYFIVTCSRLLSVSRDLEKTQKQLLKVLFELIKPKLKEDINGIITNNLAEWVSNEAPLMANK